MTASEFLAEQGRLADAQATAHARMIELNGGVGKLGVRHPGMLEDMTAWQLATENEHADTVLTLVKALEAVLAEHHTNDEYEHEDNCPDTSDEHRENYHHESIEIGEFYCELIPIRKVCDSCRDDGGYRVEYPCPTVKAITAALEGENE